MTESQSQQWNRFFSSIAHAEAAAAEQCDLIADLYRARGDEKSEAIYRSYAAEEREHYELVAGVCKKILPPSPRAMEIYGGARLSKNATLTERLATLHLSFEPSALAYLGYLCRNAHRLLNDPSWALSAHKAFQKIVREEVRHIYGGKECFEREWQRASVQEKHDVLRSLRKHGTFLALGLKTFFGESAGAFVEEMTSDYRRRVALLSQELRA